MEQWLWPELAVSTWAASQCCMSRTAPLGDLFLVMRLGNSDCMGFMWEPLPPTDILERSLLFCKERVTGKHLVALGKLWNAVVESKGEVDSQSYCVAVNETAKVMKETCLEKVVWLHEDLRERVVTGLEEHLGLSGKTEEKLELRRHRGRCEVLGGWMHAEPVAMGRSEVRIVSTCVCACMCGEGV